MPTKPSGLGRGLGSLIPAKKTFGSSSPLSSVTYEDEGYSPFASLEVSKIVGQENVLPIPVDKITPNPHQPRKNFDQEELNELIESIREHGIIQPLIVSKIGDSWQLIAGERRWRSAKALDLKTVPAIVRDMTEQKRMEIALIENLQRKDLNPLETAVAYQKLLDEFNLTQDQLAIRVGKSRPGIANTLRLLNIINEAKEALINGTITEGHAKVLAGLPQAEQMAVLEQILAGKLNVREAERITKDVIVDKKIRKVNVDLEVRDKEEKLQQFLGTKVEIKKSGGTGHIAIKFFSDEELQEIYKKIIS